MEEPTTEMPSVISEPPLPTKLPSYLGNDKMTTRSLSDWREALLDYENELSNYVVTKLEYMKNFHFSAVLHEFLKVTVKQRNMHSQEPNYLFVERMDFNDTVTVGWKWVQCPKTTRWWIKRLLKGYFSSEVRGGVPVLNSSSFTSRWQAVGYSRSDYLCHLDFDEPGVPLLEFANVLVSSSQSAPKYDVTDANCFWFASTVYDMLKDGEWPCSEYQGQYYRHKGRFAGLHILPFNLTTKVIEWIAKRQALKARNEG